MRLPSRFPSLLAASAAIVLLSARLALATAEPVVESSAGGYVGTGTLGRDGCLYSPSSDGTYGGIRKFTPDGGSILVVVFTGTGGANRGSSPSVLSLGSDGNFYGTTSGGGTSGYGTVFRFTQAGELTTLADFPADIADPARGPVGGVILARDGNLYGTASGGGPAHGGTIFRVTPAGVLTTLFSFFNFQGSSTGGAPVAALVEGPGGILYGAASRDGSPVTGGAPGTNGVAFRFDPAAGNYSILFNFNALVYSYGAGVSQPFVFAPNGNLYGVAPSCGGNQEGCVFALTTGGSYAYQCPFAPGYYYGWPGAIAGRNPQAPLTETSDGNLYGTTIGGNYNLGTVFRIVPGIDSFGGGGYTLITQQAGIGRLSLGADGNLHGGTYRLRFGPTPATGDADVAETRATLAGTVNPNGAATLARFEYGLFPDALTALTPAQDLGSGTTPADLLASLEGLAPGTTYYFRARGDNANQFQPQRGRVRSFSTAGTASAQVAVAPGAGGRRVRFRGLAGVPNVVQWSDNLLAWQSLAGTFTPDAAGFVEFVDAEPKTPSRRFYRVATAQ